MKKALKIFKIFEYILYAITAITLIVFLCIYGLDKRFLYTLYITLIVVGLVFAVILTCKEAFIKDYSAKRFSMYIFYVLTAIGVAGDLLLEHVDGYNDFNYIYYLVTIILVIADVTVFTILNYKLKEKKKPLGIVRNR